MSPAVPDAAAYTNCRRYVSALAYGAYVARERGVLALFRGLGATLLRNCFGAVVWFLPYEYLRIQFGGSPTGVFFAGGIASWVYWFAIYPIDLVKTRIQGETSNTSAQRWGRGVFSGMRYVIRTSGVRGLFVGLWPCMLRAFPANAAGILAYEHTRQLLTGSSA